MVTPEIRQIVRKFLDALSSKGITVDKIIIYGSYAAGLDNVHSDIDIAVISPDFGMDRFEEGKTLLQIAWRIDPRLQPVPISSEVFEKDTWVPLIYEIREKGIEIKAA